MDARTPSSSEGVAAPVANRPTGRFTLTPINLRRWQNFKANSRGYVSLWIFLVLFVGSLGAEFIANDKPFFVSFEGRFFTMDDEALKQLCVRRLLRKHHPLKLLDDVADLVGGHVLPQARGGHSTFLLPAQTELIHFFQPAGCFPRYCA